MRHARQLEVVELALDLLFDLIKTLIVKPHQRLGVFIDQFHIIAHRQGMAFDNMAQFTVFG